MALEGRRLHLLAVEGRRESQLRQHEWLVAGHPLEMPEVAPQRLRPLEEDVEADEILTLDLHVLGRREADVAGEHLRVRAVHLGDDRGQRPLHRADPVDAHDVARHLVSDGDPEYLRTPADLRHGRVGRGQAGIENPPSRRSPWDRLHAPVVIVETDEELQPMLCREVEDVGRGRRVDAHGVEARGCHGAEVGVHLCVVRKARAVEPRRERAVGRSSHTKRCVVTPKVLTKCRNAARAHSVPPQVHPTPRS